MEGTSYLCRWLVSVGVMGLLLMGSVECGEWSVGKGAWAAKTKTTYTYRKGGFLFAANSSFPTTAEDVKGFVKLGKKHSQTNPVLWSEGGELNLHILVVMTQPYRTPGVNLVIREKGKSEHLDSQFIGVQKKVLDIFISPLSFSSSGFKKGTVYELQATIAREVRKNVFHITVLAQTSFRL